MRNHADIEYALDTYGDAVWRACMVHLHQRADCEDAFQETFVRYACHDAAFNDEQHRKAWLIRVAINICKDSYKRAERKNTSLDELDFEPVAQSAKQELVHEGAAAHELRSALEHIKENYRSVLYLKYFEGYTAKEIGKMLDMPENTVYTNLSRGKDALKEVLTHGKT